MLELTLTTRDVFYLQLSRTELVKVMILEIPKSENGDVRIGIEAARSVLVNREEVQRRLRPHPRKGAKP
jgi:sRNA-binding carbon storage regulator CsrA